MITIHPMHHIIARPPNPQTHPKMSTPDAAAPVRAKLGRPDQATASSGSAFLMACRHYGPLLSRIIAAILGGYLLAVLASIATLALPIPRTEAVLLGMLLSFLVYAGAAIWVFAVATAWRAWCGLLLAALPMLLAALWCWPLTRQ